MKIFRVLFPVILILWFGCLLTPQNLFAGGLIPSTWQGEIRGRVHNENFRLPLTIEIRQPLPYEKNPMHICVATDKPDDIGHVFLSSAQQLSTSRGPVTLQYFFVSLSGSRMHAGLVDDHRAEAAVINGFSGPNVSAEQASDLMQGILEDAWGATEMFRFDVGATLVITFFENRLSGTLKGSGRSYTNTSSSVNYFADINAKRLR